MDDDHQQIVIAAYGDLEAARTDFNDLEARLKHGLEMRTAALVTKDANGEAQVIEATNKHGQTGALIGAGVGIILGVLLEPVALGILVGGVGGALAAALAEHELRIGLKREVGAALDKGTAVVLALVYKDGRPNVETTLIRANSKTALRMDRATIKILDDLVAEEIHKLPGHGVSADKPDTSS